MVGGQFGCWGCSIVVVEVGEDVVPGAGRTGGLSSRLSRFLDVAVFAGPVGGEGVVAAFAAAAVALQVVRSWDIGFGGVAIRLSRFHVNP